MPDSKPKYTSPSSGDLVTAAQYITELLITRQYAAKGINLPSRFWTIDKYKKKFKQTIFWVNRFLKLYPDNHAVVVQILRQPKHCRLWTLRSDELKKDIQAEIDRRENLVEQTFEDNTQSQPSKKFSKPNLKSKLNALDE